MKKLVRVLIISLACFTFQLSFARNQVVDAGPGAHIGSTYANLLLKPRIVEGILDKCTSANSDFLTQSKNTKVSWNERNQKYLALVPGLEDEIEEILHQGNKTETLAPLRNSIINSADENIKDFTLTIDGLEKDLQSKYCIYYASKISEGTFDLSGDAESKQFLDNRLQEDLMPNFRVEIDFPATDSSTPPSIDLKTLALIADAGKYISNSKVIEKKCEETDSCSLQLDAPLCQKGRSISLKSTLCLTR